MSMHQQDQNLSQDTSVATEQGTAVENPLEQNSMISPVDPDLMIKADAHQPIESSFMDAIQDDNLSQLNDQQMRQQLDALKATEQANGGFDATYGSDAEVRADIQRAEDLQAKALHQQALGRIRSDLENLPDWNNADVKATANASDLFTEEELAKKL